LSPHFLWLRILIDDYEQRKGDGKGEQVWNWFMEQYRPDGWEDELEEN
jgi:hypothetical protein